MSQTGRLLKSIGQAAISVTDIDRAIEFYRDTLDMQFLFQVPGQHMAFFQCGEVRLFLNSPETPEFAARPIHYYRVDDIDAAYTEIQGRGVEFKHEPRVVHKDDMHELWLTFFNDPDGNHLALMEERPV